VLDDEEFFELRTWGIRDRKSFFRYFHKKQGLFPASMWLKLKALQLHTTIPRRKVDFYVKNEIFFAAQTHQRKKCLTGEEW